MPAIISTLSFSRLVATFIFIGLFSVASLGQTMTQNVNDLSPKEEYDNVKSVPVHSDENASVFVIFVKKSVRKHVHQYHTEVVTILEGTGRMYLGGDYFDVAKGDHIVIPPNTPHAVTTTSGKPLKVLSTQSPQFLGQDIVFIEEEPTATNSENGGTNNNGNNAGDDDIPEFEGEND